ncbi:MAG: hypothetical protein AB7I37_27355 [Pirellulales bacterium]
MYLFGIRIPPFLVKSRIRLILRGGVVSSRSSQTNRLNATSGVHDAFASRSPMTIDASKLGDVRYKPLAKANN